MREDIVEYVARCDTCQRVKAEHQRSTGLLQPLEIPIWKWEDISMDFIVGLPCTQKGNDSIWVIVLHKINSRCKLKLELCSPLNKAFLAPSLHVMHSFPSTYGVHTSRCLHHFPFQPLLFCPHCFPDSQKLKEEEVGS
jgi:hypothetical protein